MKKGVNLLYIHLFSALAFTLFFIFYLFSCKAFSYEHAISIRIYLKAFYSQIDGTDLTFLHSVSLV